MVQTSINKWKAKVTAGLIIQDKKENERWASMIFSDNEYI
jgi:hypothetical protein